MLHYPYQISHAKLQYFIILQPNKWTQKYAICNGWVIILHSAQFCNKWILFSSLIAIYNYKILYSIMLPLVSFQKFERLLSWYSFWHGAEKHHILFCSSKNRHFLKNWWQASYWSNSHFLYETWLYSTASTWLQLTNPLLRATCSRGKQGSVSCRWTTRPAALSDCGVKVCNITTWISQPGS